MKKKLKMLPIDVHTEEDLTESDFEASLIGGISPYRTSDLGCAAALHCRGFSLVNLDRKDPQRIGFQFQRTRDVMSVVAAYWDSSLTVDAQTYFGSIRNLKNRLHSPE